MDSSNPYLHSTEPHQSIIELFLQHIQPHRYTSNHKKQIQYIQYYNLYYFTRYPEFNELLIRLLLFGNKKYIGLCQLCGIINMKSLLSLQKSSIMCMELLIRLCDTQQYNTKYGQTYYNTLIKHLDLSLLRKFVLERHILNERTQHNNLYEFIYKLHVSFSHIPIQQYIQNKNALNKYLQYKKQYDKTIELDKLQVQRSMELLQKKPMKWSDILIQPIDNDTTQPNNLMQLNSIVNERAHNITDPLQVYTNLNTSKYNINSSFLDLHSTQYNPSLYLATVHKHTSLQQLTSGLQNIQQQQHIHQHQQKHLLHENLLYFIYEINQLKQIKKLISNQLNSSDKYNQVKMLQNRINNVLQHLSSPYYSTVFQSYKQLSAILYNIKLVQTVQPIIDIINNIQHSYNNKQIDECIVELNRYNTIRFITDNKQFMAINDVLNDSTNTIYIQFHTQITEVIKQINIHLLNQFYYHHSESQLKQLLSQLHAINHNQYAVELLVQYIQQSIQQHDILYDLIVNTNVLFGLYNENQQFMVQYNILINVIVERYEIQLTLITNTQYSDMIDTLDQLLQLSITDAQKQRLLQIETVLVENYIRVLYTAIIGESNEYMSNVQFNHQSDCKLVINQLNVIWCKLLDQLKLIKIYNPHRAWYNAAMEKNYGIYINLIVVSTQNYIHQHDRVQLLYVINYIIELKNNLIQLQLSQLTNYCQITINQSAVFDQIIQCEHQCIEQYVQCQFYDNQSIIQSYCNSIIQYTNIDSIDSVHGNIINVLYHEIVLFNEIQSICNPTEVEQILNQYNDLLINSLYNIYNTNACNTNLCVLYQLYIDIQYIDSICDKYILNSTSQTIDKLIELIEQSLVQYGTNDILNTCRRNSGELIAVADRSNKLLFSCLQ